MRRIFTLFVASFIVLIGQAQTSQGPNFAATGVSFDKAEANVAWSNAANARTDNASVASVSLSGNGANGRSDYLRLSGFNFNIPDGYTITGISVALDSRIATNNQFSGSLSLVDATGAVTAFSKSLSSSIGNTFTTTTYGGANDKWGSAFTSDDIEDSDFGIVIEIQKENGGATRTFEVDYASITVFYTNSAPTANDDIFNAALIGQQVSGNVILNDTDPSDETLTATLVEGPSVGTLDFSSNGDFTYTPPATGFEGGPVTFTYSVTDNGVPPATSNTATVTLEYPEETTTPVTFISFDAKKANSGTLLTWNVADEINVARYEVEKNSGNGFVKIGEVAARKSPSYSFTDVQVAQGSVQYRVRNVDVDGAFKYTSIINFKNGASSVVLRAFPMPAGNNLTVQHTAVGNGRISIVNAGGQIVKSLVPQKGAVQTDLKLDGLKAGVYLLRFDAGNGKLETLKIVKQ